MTPPSYVANIILFILYYTLVKLAVIYNVIACKLINVFLYLYIQFHYPNLLLHIKIRRSNVFFYIWLYNFTLSVFNIEIHMSNVSNSFGYRIRTMR